MVDSPQPVRPRRLATAWGSAGDDPVLDAHPLVGLRGSPIEADQLDTRVAHCDCDQAVVDRSSAYAEPNQLSHGAW